MAMGDHQAMIEKRTKTKGENNKDLAEKISAAIDASRLTSSEVAKRCNVTPQAVGGWKTTGRISKDMLPIFADVVKFPLSHFIAPVNYIDENADKEVDWVQVEAEKIAKLISLYSRSTATGRDFIINAAERAEKRVNNG